LKAESKKVLSEGISNNKGTVFTFLFLVIAPFIFDSILLSILISDQTYFHQFTYLQWSIFYLLAMFAMAFGLTHTTFIAVFSGYFLSYISIPFVIVSYLLASVIGYFVGRLITGEKVINTIMTLPKAVPIAGELKKREFMIILLSRLSPALPFAVTNLLLSILKADFKKYFIAGSIGMLPRTLIFIWTGTQAKSIAEVIRNPETISVSRISTLIFLVVSVTGLFYYILKALKTGTNRTNSDN
jgi:uncharacterized membrane protein YdjX (TVP38/TMEM64 family)